MPMTIRRRFFWRLIMAAVNLPDVATSAGVPKIARTDAGNAVGQRFSAAMEKAVVDPALDPQRVGSASASVGETADAQERARRALNLNSTAPAQRKAVHGDAILHGLQNIRGVFDAQETRINSLVSRSALDTNALMATQWEVTKLSVLVDMTSKLAGKFTQLPETLLKGQ
jgi:type III secretion system YscI/HrpB-like protein